MGYGIAENMFKRADHPVQNAPIQLTFGSIHRQFGLFVQITCRLPHHPLQTWHQLGKRDHPGTQQSILQISRDPRLL